MTNEDKILQSLSAMQAQLNDMQTQLNEHGAVLGAIQHASEVHKADMDNLTHQVANLSQGVKADLKELNETNKSLLEMYGEHEAQIRTLRRRPV